MTTKQRFFSSVLLLELIFLLLYVWVRVTSRFKVQLVISVSFLTVSLHWRNRWTNSVNLHIWRLEGSVQSNSIFLLKLPEISFSLFSLGLIILRFSLIKSREWSTAQLASSAKLKNLPTSLLYSLISIGYRSAAGFNTKLLSPASTLSLVQLLHTSLSRFISVLLLCLFIQSRILRFSVSQGCEGLPLGRGPFSTWGLSSGNLFLSLSGMPLYSPLSGQNWKTTSSPVPTDL